MRMIFTYMVLLRDVHVEILSDVMAGVCCIMYYVIADKSEHFHDNACFHRSYGWQPILMAPCHSCSTDAEILNKAHYKMA
ncbi:hypothetical protein T12_5223 [Trichinella patagoniensis]|uniref:Uncharacterized protein n=1 Tax=Trichinella patagoniensis TaxID=990121 RepID=A0A0V0ZJ60_9BILA|nr:hypothetical protein T12_5223 [Trichinella patagoniensis]